MPSLHTPLRPVIHPSPPLNPLSPTPPIPTPQAKRFATDECFRVALDAQQLLGGYGFLRDFPIERLVRDLRVHSILEGEGAGLEGADLGGASGR